jgi:hypothetical protein
MGQEGVNLHMVFRKSVPPFVILGLSCLLGLLGHTSPNCMWLRLQTPYRTSKFAEAGWSAQRMGTAGTGRVRRNWNRVQSCHSEIFQRPAEDANGGGVTSWQMAPQSRIVTKNTAQFRGVNGLDYEGGRQRTRLQLLGSGWQEFPYRVL